jgi:Family of unknown function (DUF5706)
VQRRPKPPAPLPSGPGAAADTSDIEFLLGQTGEWIRNADTKSGLLLAALTVLLGSVSSSARGLRGLWSGHPHRPEALIVLAGSVVLLAVAYALLVAVLLPRHSSTAATRYAWPWVNTASLEILEHLAPDSRRTEAWRQAKQLAAIAARKHRLFTAAVWFSSGSTMCLLGWSVLRP